jgi:hypothetical protein
MTPLERLLLTARFQHEDHDLPIHLLKEIEELLANAGTLIGRDALVDELATQIENFDSHAGAGCFCESYSAAQIAATLKRLCSRPGE